MKLPKMLRVFKGDGEGHLSIRNSKKNSKQKNKQHQPLSGVTAGMLKGIKSLQNITAKEIMIPRIDIDCIDKDLDITGLQEILSHSRHSRFPVYTETIDKIIGILYAKDLIPYWVAQQEFKVEDICRKPYFIPESMKVDSLLAEFQHRHVHIAMVVDEYGGISGIVCLEDILELIVGDIQDEFDQEGEDIITLEEGIYLCDARLNISNFNEELNLDLPDDDCDTVGGFVFSQFGKIPGRYEKTRYQNLEFIVQKVEGHRIETIKVIVQEPDEASVKTV